MTPIWSIYRKEEAPLEGTELHDMLQRFPQAGTHNSNNYIFVSTHPEASNPLLVDELVDVEGVKLTGDALAWAMAQELSLSDRSRAVHLSKSTAAALHRHPAWRIWCGNYGDEGREQFEADWAYVGAMTAEGMPDAPYPWPAYDPAMSYAEGKEVMWQAIHANAA